MENWFVFIYILIYIISIHIHTLHFIQLQAKHDFVEQELTKSKEREKVMAVELGRLREEVRNCIYTGIYSHYEQITCITHAAC